MRARCSNPVNLHAVKVQQKQANGAGALNSFLLFPVKSCGQGGGEEAPAERLEHHKRAGLVAPCDLPCLLRLASTKNEHLGV